MISFHPEQTLSLSITNLILLYCSISTLLPTSMVTSNEMRPHPVQRKCILLQINILIACMLQYRLFNIAFFAPILTDTDTFAIVFHVMVITDKWLILKSYTTLSK